MTGGGVMDIAQIEAQIAREQFMALPPRHYLIDALILTALVVNGTGTVVLLFVFAPLEIAIVIMLWIMAACVFGLALCGACAWRDYFARIRMGRG